MGAWLNSDWPQNCLGCSELEDLSALFSPGCRALYPTPHARYRGHGQPETTILHIRHDTLAAHGEIASSELESKAQQYLRMVVTGAVRRAALLPQRCTTTAIPSPPAAV